MSQKSLLNRSSVQLFVIKQLNKHKIQQLHNLTILLFLLVFFSFSSLFSQDNTPTVSVEDIVVSEGDTISVQIMAPHFDRPAYNIEFVGPSQKEDFRARQGEFPSWMTIYANNVEEPTSYYVKVTPPDGVVNDGETEKVFTFTILVRQEGDKLPEDLFKWTSSEFNVTVMPPNLPPTASIAPIDENLILMSLRTEAKEAFHLQYGGNSPRARSAFDNYNPVLGGVVITLHGTGTDPDGNDDALTYQWEQIVTPGITIVELTGADTATPSFTTPPQKITDQQLVFSLIVTDELGAESQLYGYGSLVSVRVMSLSSYSLPATTNTPTQRQERQAMPSSYSLPATTDITDPNFEQTLIDLGIDNNGKNGNILNSDAANVTSLDVSNKNISSLIGIEAFTSLTRLDCRSNQLVSLDVSQNTSLAYLNCRSNQLSELNVSQNTALISLNANMNNLEELDVSNNTELTSLRCKENQLTSLNVKNGNNSNFIFFKSTNNSSLTCIQVDNMGDSRSKWHKDGDATYSENCTSPTNIGKSKQEKTISDFDGNKGFELSEISVSPNPTGGVLNITVVEKANYRLVNIRGQILKKGILAKGKSSISLSSFAKGVYLLNLKTSKGNFTKKVVKN